MQYLYLKITILDIQQHADSGMHGLTWRNGTQFMFCAHAHAHAQIQPHPSSCHSSNIQIRILINTFYFLMKSALLKGDSWRLSVQSGTKSSWNLNSSEKHEDFTFVRGSSPGLSLPTGLVLFNRRSHTSMRQPCSQPRGQWRTRRWSPDLRRAVLHRPWSILRQWKLFIHPWGNLHRL